MLLALKATQRLLHLLNSAIVLQKHFHTICDKWAWLCANKTLFTETDGRLDLGPEPWIVKP
jgi:hypothetical protein